MGCQKMNENSAHFKRYLKLSQEWSMSADPIQKQKSNWRPTSLRDNKVSLVTILELLGMTELDEQRQNVLM